MTDPAEWENGIEIIDQAIAGNAHPDNALLARVLIVQQTYFRDGLAGLAKECARQSADMDPDTKAQFAQAIKNAIKGT